MCQWVCLKLIAAFLASRLITMHQKNSKRGKEQIQLIILQTGMCNPCLSDDLQEIDDAHKTAVIDWKLNRLNIDMATLQET